MMLKPPSRSYRFYQGSAFKSPNDNYINGKAQETHLQNTLSTIMHQNIDQE